MLFRFENAFFTNTEIRRGACILNITEQTPLISIEEVKIGQNIYVEIWYGDNNSVQVNDTLDDVIEYLELKNIKVKLPKFLGRQRRVK